MMFCSFFYVKLNFTDKRLLLVILHIDLVVSVAVFVSCARVGCISVGRFQHLPLSVTRGQVFVCLLFLVFTADFIYMRIWKAVLLFTLSFKEFYLINTHQLDL